MAVTDFLYGTEPLSGANTSTHVYYKINYAITKLCIFNSSDLKVYRMLVLQCHYVTNHHQTSRPPISQLCNCARPDIKSTT
jgi:hypothetical protein